MKPCPFGGDKSLPVTRWFRPAGIIDDFKSVNPGTITLILPEPEGPPNEVEKKD
jgi:hypothetical protein